MQKLTIAQDVADQPQCQEVLRDGLESVVVSRRSLLGRKDTVEGYLLGPKSFEYMLHYLQRQGLLESLALVGLFFGDDRYQSRSLPSSRLLWSEYPHAFLYALNPYGLQNLWVALLPAAIEIAALVYSVSTTSDGLKNKLLEAGLMHPDNLTLPSRQEGSVEIEHLGLQIIQPEKRNVAGAAAEMFYIVWPCLRRVRKSLA